MNIRGKKIQIRLYGILLLFILISAPTIVAALDIQLTEQPVSLEQTAITSQNAYDSVNNNFIDYLTQLQFKLIYKQTLHNIIQAINWLQYNFKLPAFAGSITQQLIHSPIAILSLGLLFLITFFVWVFRREDTDFIEMTSSQSNIEHAVFIEEKQSDMTNEMIDKQCYSNVDEPIEINHNSKNAASKK